MLILSMVISGNISFLIPLTSATLHEFGHIISARLRKINLKKLDVGIFGARLTMDTGLCTYNDEILICAAGPAVNFITAYIAFAVSQYTGIESQATELFILSSLSLGIINILPIYSFDGGRILYALISKISNPKAAEGAVRFFSFISLFLLWSISLYLLLRTTASLSLFVFSVSVFSSLFIDTSQKSIENE